MWKVSSLLGDNCKWIRDTYETMVQGIFAENTIESVLIWLWRLLMLLNLNLTTATIVKAMGSNYKSATFSLAIFQNWWRVWSTDSSRRAFSICCCQWPPRRDKIGKKMRTNEFFNEQWESAGIKYGEDVPEDRVCRRSLSSWKDWFRVLYL